MEQDVGAVVERLRELLTKATPGPWVADGAEIAHADGPAPWGKPGGKRERANVALIAEAVSALPTLLDALSPPCPPHQWGFSPPVGYFHCAKCGCHIMHNHPRYAALMEEREATLRGLADAPTAARWECFQDVAYFDMWCVRRIGSQTFGEGFHVTSREEAEGLRDLLNASAIEAGTAETAQTGSVHESAVGAAETPEHGQAIEQGGL